MSRYLRLVALNFAITTYVFGLASTSAAQTTILYSNDFEDPNQPIQASCGNSLDQSGINLLYGTDGFMFSQQNTVEAVVLHDPSNLYKHQSDENGDYALGMLSTIQDDQLALTFDSEGLPFINVGMDISPIDVQGCGGPVGVAAPEFRVRLLDSPGGVFDWSQGVLDEETMTGIAGTDQWSFAWTNTVVGLDASKATDGHVSVVFDLIASGYAAFDNLSITASVKSGIVDGDLDGTPGDTDNCPKMRNPDQRNRDEDSAGDVCDPAPRDPEACGDVDGDDVDDCADWCKTHDVASCDSDDASVASMADEPDASDSSETDASVDASKPPEEMSAHHTDAGPVAAPKDGGLDGGGTGKHATRASGCGCSTIGGAGFLQRWWYLPPLAALFRLRHPKRRVRSAPV